MLGGETVPDYPGEKKHRPHHDFHSCVSLVDSDVNFDNSLSHNNYYIFTNIFICNIIGLIISITFPSSHIHECLINLISLSFLPKI